MTFNLDTSTISEDEARLFLDASKIDYGNFSIQTVLAIRPHYSVIQAHNYLEKMLTSGYLSCDDRLVNYTPSDFGYSLLESGLKKRITRSVAESILEKAITKVKAWNSDSEKVIAISSVKLFGSLLDECDDYGDVDIEIVMNRRAASPTQLQALIDGAPVSVKKDFFFTIDPEKTVLTRQQNQAITHVRRGLTPLAICPHGTIEDLGASWKEVYAFNVDNMQEIDPDDTIHPRTKPLQRPSPEVRGPGATLIPAKVEGKAIFTPWVAQLATSQYLAQTADSGWRKFEKKCNKRKPLTEIDGSLALLAGQEAWPLTAQAPFDKIREVQQIGISMGILGSGPVTFRFRKGVFFCSIPSAQENRLGFQFGFEGRSRDISLLPIVMDMNENCLLHPGDNPHSTSLDHVSVSRSLSSAMFELYEMLKIPAGIKIDLAMMWDPSDPAPTLPSLSSISRAVIKEARTMKVHEADVEMMREKIEASTKKHGWVLHQLVSLEFGSGPGMTMESRAQFMGCLSDTLADVRSNWYCPDLEERSDNLKELFDESCRDWSLTLERDEMVNLYDWKKEDTPFRDILQDLKISIMSEKEIIDDSYPYEV
ncbi:MAG: hypothetical protein ABJN42_09820 [Roseibium sp.]|uniref:hypothetical protein n=1 Tax=Roseibium sp. TaxID=1936156 RepID=UPI003297F45B